MKTDAVKTDCNSDLLKKSVTMINYEILPDTLKDFDIFLEAIEYSIQWSDTICYGLGLVQTLFHQPLDKRGQNNELPTQ